MGFLLLLLFIMSCLLFVAPEKQNWKAAEAEGKLWSGLFEGAKAARPQTQRGHECLCHEMSVLCVLPVALARSRDAEGRRGASRFPPGPQPGSRLPAGDAVETAAFQETGLKAECSKNDQPSSGWGH